MKKSVEQNIFSPSEYVIQNVVHSFVGAGDSGRHFYYI